MITIRLRIPTIGVINVTGTDDQLNQLFRELNDLIGVRTLYYRVIA